ncbi:hypothetical protein [Roseomonas elaeocarpi]|uniref:Uncharacterized protein n=1 Tax=Roseomonas elaeocarpi TaxID=907779 RepID=A0ABV6JZ99_9PROT
MTVNQWATVYAITLAVFVGGGYIAAKVLAQKGVKLTRELIFRQIKIQLIGFPIGLALMMAWAYHQGAGYLTIFLNYLLGAVLSNTLPFFFLWLRSARSAPWKAVPSSYAVSTAVYNERIKLFAGWLDRASTACLTVGLATPAAGLLYNIGNFRGQVDGAELVPGLAIWLAVSLGLHLLARRALGGLRL